MADISCSADLNGFLIYQQILRSAKIKEISGNLKIWYEVSDTKAKLLFNWVIFLGGFSVPLNGKFKR